MTSTAEERADSCPGAPAVSIYYVCVCILSLLWLFQVNAIFECLSCRNIHSLIKHSAPKFFSFSLHLKPALSPAIRS